MALSELMQKEDRKIPQEMRKIIESLAEPSKRGITLILAEKGELSFKKLLAEVNPMNPSTLDHHLKGLMKAGLAENYYKKKPDTNEYSFYRSTELAIDFLKLIGARLD